MMVIWSKIKATPLDAIHESSGKVMVAPSSSTEYSNSRFSDQAVPLAKQAKANNGVSQ